MAICGRSPGTPSGLSRNEAVAQGGKLVVACHDASRHPARTIVSKVRVQSFAISIDGYGAGPSQDLQHPLGVNGPELMEWFFHTRVWRQMHGQPDGETGIDNEMAE